MTIEFETCEEPAPTGPPEYRVTDSRRTNISGELDEYNLTFLIDGENNVLYGVGEDPAGSDMTVVSYSIEDNFALTLLDTLTVAGVNLWTPTAAFVNGNATIAVGNGAELHTFNVSDPSNIIHADTDGTANDMEHVASVTGADGTEYVVGISIPGGTNYSVEHREVDGATIVGGAKDYLGLYDAIGTESILSHNGRVYVGAQQRNDWDVFDYGSTIPFDSPADIYAGATTRVPTPEMESIRHGCVNHSAGLAVHADSNNWAYVTGVEPVGI